MNRDDKQIGLGKDDKKVDATTDSRILGSFMTIVYQKYSHNLSSHPINNQYARLLQTDPAFSRVDKDLISGLIDSDKKSRIPIKDVILHEKFISQLVKDREL